MRETTPLEYSSRPNAVLYAGFWKRAVALLVDVLILVVISFIVGSVVLLGLLNLNVLYYQTDVESAANLLELAIVWLYFALQESSSKQATLGKRMMGIKVTDMNGNRLSFLRATGRHFGKIISSLILLIGYMMAAFTAKKQTLHDIMAGCLVVHKE